AAGNASEQPLLATGLALESMVRAKPSTAAARSALVEARVGLDANRGLPQPFGHPVVVGDMQAVAMTPDGARFVTGGRNGEVVFWDRITRAETHRYDGVHDSGVKALAVSGDGRWLASTGGFQAIVWNLAGAEPEPVLLHEIERISGLTIWDVAFSEDGSRVALAVENSVQVFDRASKNQITMALEGESFDLLSVDFLDNERLAVGDGVGNLRMIEVATGRELTQPVVAGYNGNDVWQVEVNQQLGLVMTVSTDNTVKSWAIDDDRFELVAALEDESIHRPRGLIPAPSGAEMLIGAADGRLYRMDPATGTLNTTGASASTGLHTDEVRDTAVSQNGWVVSLGDDQRVQVWRHIEDLALIDEIVAEGDPILDLALSPGATLLAASTIGGTVVHDAESGALLHRFARPTESVGFVTDSVVVAASAEGVIELWDVTRGVLIGENTGHNGGPIRAIATSPDGNYIATGGDDQTVVLWSGETLEEVRPLAAHDRPVYAVDFTPDGESVVSLGFDQQLRISPVDGGDGRSLDVAQDGPQTVAVHPEGEVIALGGSIENIDIIDLDGKLLRSMAPHPGGVWDLAFTADGLSVVGTSRASGEVQLWDWATGERLGPAFGESHDRREPDVVVGADGTIWTSGLDGVIRRLDVLDQQIGCDISRDVMDARMRQRFLSSDELMSCR
ncbi:MAG: WD40 repeat domain-containing protein, partial [Acidimicrobiales bacterium]